MLHTQYAASGLSLRPRCKLSLIQLTLIVATFTRAVIRTNFLGIAFEKVYFENGINGFHGSFRTKLPILSEQTP